MALNLDSLALLSHEALTPEPVVFVSQSDASNRVHLLSDRAFLTLNGQDASKFIQGQITCDVAQVNETHSSRGAHCTPKGRAIASFYLAQTAEQNYLLTLPADNAEALLKSLGKYIVFSKASINADTDRIALGLHGDQVMPFIRDQIGDITAGANTVVSDSGMALLHSNEAAELWLSNQQFQALWPQIREHFTAANNDSWQQFMNAQGLAEITEATREEFVPQMFGFAENDGISYKKGCYTGQEIVARLHFLGKQKRQLYRFEHTTPSIAVTAAVQNAEGKTIGQVINVSPVNGLAVVGANEPTLNATIEQQSVSLIAVNPDTEDA